jgi:hypothetical protein
MGDLQAADRGNTALPALYPLGVDGLLIRFGAQLGEAANRAALAFRAAVQGIPRWAWWKAQHR